MRTPRLLTTGIGALAVIGLLSACSGGAAGSNAASDVEITDTIAVGVAPDFFYTPFYFAVQKGFFADHGIQADLVEFPSGGEAVDGINAGQIDLTSASPTTLVNLAGKDSPARAISSNSVAEGWFAIVGGKKLAGAKSVDDLDGATFAAPHKGILDMETRTTFEVNGGDISKVDYQDVKAPQLVTGLARGDFDAVALWEPNVTKTLDSVPDTSIVLNSDEVMPSYGFTMASEKIWGDQDLADRVFAALQDGIDYMSEHQDETLQLVMKNSGISDEKIAQSIQDKMTFRLAFGADDIASLQAAQAFMTGQGVVSTTDEQFAATYMPEVYESYAASAK